MACPTSPAAPGGRKRRGVWVSIPQPIFQRFSSCCRWRYLYTAVLNGLHAMPAGSPQASYACYAGRRPQQAPHWNAAGALARRAFGFSKTKICPLAGSGLSPASAARELAAATPGSSAARVTDLPDHLLDEILGWLRPLGAREVHTQVRPCASAWGRRVGAVGAPVIELRSPILPKELLLGWGGLLLLCVQEALQQKNQVVAPKPDVQGSKRGSCSY